MYKRAARFTKYSKPFPAARHKAKSSKEIAKKLDRNARKALLRQLRPVWAPFVELVARSSRPLSDFTSEPMPQILKDEILLLGIDIWLAKHHRAGRKNTKRAGAKDEE